ncbi:TPM domain-containing protein [Luteolibacter sp. LG18]|uniref:TPM domain-containing protein n=1 Tax=Luteolibacter sp. LG18 TaxID=2819286 RepID=UPI0030C68D9F
MQRIHRAAAGCPHCGFSLGDADAIFGSEEVRLRSLTDAAGLMRREEQRQVENAMLAFNRRFPQLFIAVHTGSFSGVANLRQFGFWLLNRGAFEDVAVDRPNEAGVLIAIDAEARAAGITFGYLLDAYLDEEDTFHCLSRAHSYWLEGRFADGLVKAIGQLETLLKKRSRQARRNPAKFERRVARPPQVENLVQKIRHGRQPLPQDTRENEEARP